MNEPPLSQPLNAQGKSELESFSQAQPRDPYISSTLFFHILYAHAAFSWFVSTITTLLDEKMANESIALAPALSNKAKGWMLSHTSDTPSERQLPF